VEEEETLSRQRLQRRTLDFAEDLADLLPRGAVHARVGHGHFPTPEIVVLFFQGSKGTTPQGIVLDIANARFDLALLSGCPRPRRQHGNAIMLGEGS
jgi:hypothetical protein